MLLVESDKISLAASAGDGTHRSPAPAISKADTLQTFYHMCTGKFIKLLVGGLFANMKNETFIS